MSLTLNQKLTHVVGGSLSELRPGRGAGALHQGSEGDGVPASSLP